MMRQTTIATGLLLSLTIAAAEPHGPADWGDRLALTEVAERYGLALAVENDHTVALRAATTELIFHPDSRKLGFGGLTLWLNGPLLRHNGAFTVTRADLDAVIDPLCRPSTTLRDTRVRTVVLDPGHGGDDSGAIGRRRLYEKKVVLDIAKRVRRKLQANQVSALMTRTGDQTVSLKERAARTFRWKGDLLISIHLNAASNPLAEGIETFVLPAPGHPSTGGGNGALHGYPGNRFDAASLLLASYVHRGLLAQPGAADRGIKRARFELLRNAPCPAVLVECGFISHAGEEARILDPNYRDALAEGIARGILTMISKSAGS